MKILTNLVSIVSLIAINENVTIQKADHITSN
jgi:hypothetical protein